MNYYQAHKLLDETRNGYNHSKSDITAALGLTGDIDPGVFTDGFGWRRPGAEGRTPRVPLTTVCRTGSGFPGIAINDHPAN